MKLALLMLLAATQLIEVYPNPYGLDEAEYIKFHCDSNCVLTDGEGEITVSAGTHIAAKNLSYFKERFGHEADIEFPPKMALSNEGEEICLNEDCFYYGKDVSLLDDGIIYYRTESGWDFKYEDWSNFSCVTDRVEGRLIITPADYTLDDGWIVASYTFSAPFKPAKLYVDASPPYIPCRELEIPNTYFLNANSHRNFHYKFAVKGENVVLTTENWIFTKKGYIVEFKSGRIADTLLKLLESDERYISKKPEYCTDSSYRNGYGGRYSEFSANVTLFIIPDCNPILEFISSARSRLYIISPYMNLGWYTTGGLYDSIKRAIENGAEVSIFLDSRYADKNVVESLRNSGVRVNLVEGLHGKAIVSDDRLLITSANMNMYGLKLNREVGVIIEDRELANFVVEDIGSVKKDEITTLDLTFTVIAFLISLAIFIRYGRAKNKF